MDSHKMTEHITKEAATQAAVQYDQLVYKLLKDNGLEELFTKAINATDPEALQRAGYKLIDERQQVEVPVADGSEVTKMKVVHNIYLVKIVDSTTFTLESLVRIDSMKMKESN